MESHYEHVPFTFRQGKDYDWKRDPFWLADFEVAVGDDGTPTTAPASASQPASPPATSQALGGGTVATGPQPGPLASVPAPPTTYNAPGTIVPTHSGLLPPGGAVKLGLVIAGLLTVGYLVGKKR